jgi:hypothetical protein
MQAMLVCARNTSSWCERALFATNTRIARILYECASSDVCRIARILAESVPRRVALGIRAFGLNTRNPSLVLALRAFRSNVRHAGYARMTRISPEHKSCWFVLGMRELGANARRSRRILGSRAF